MRRGAEKDLINMNQGQRAPRPPVRRVRVRTRREWSRIAAKAGLLIIALTVGYHSLTYALRPHCEAWLVSREIPRMQQKKAQGAQLKTDLQWQIKYAASEKGAKNLARDFGYVKEGEVPLLMPENERLTQGFEQPAEPEAGLWERFMLVLCKICRAGPELVEAEESSQDS